MPMPVDPEVVGRFADKVELLLRQTIAAQQRSTKELISKAIGSGSTIAVSFNPATETVAVSLRFPTGKRTVLFEARMAWVVSQFEIWRLFRYARIGSRVPICLATRTAWSSYEGEPVIWSGPWLSLTHRTRK